MFTAEEITYLKGIFVTQESCDRISSSIERDVTTIKTQLAGVTAYLKVLAVVGSATCVGVVGIAVNSIFGG